MRTIGMMRTMGIEPTHQTDLTGPLRSALKRMEASDAANLLIDAFVNEKQVGSRVNLADCLESVSSRLAPAEKRRVYSQAVHLICDVLAVETDIGTRYLLVSSMAPFAKWIDS
jgi:Tfp pilus assembly pilus retraction ATPase PilT